jgi:hypothetical protein
VEGSREEREDKRREERKDRREPRGGEGGDKRRVKTNGQYIRSALARHTGLVRSITAEV